MHIVWCRAGAIRWATASVKIHCKKQVIVDLSCIVFQTLMPAIFRWLFVVGKIFGSILS